MRTWLYTVNETENRKNGPRLQVGALVVCRQIVAADAGTKCNKTLWTNWWNNFGEEALQKRLEGCCRKEPSSCRNQASGRRSGDDDYRRCRGFVAEEAVTALNPPRCRNGVAWDAQRRRTTRDAAKRKSLTAVFTNDDDSRWRFVLAHQQTDTKLLPWTGAKKEKQKQRLHRCAKTQQNSNPAAVGEDDTLSNYGGGDCCAVCLCQKQDEALPAAVSRISCRRC